MQLELLVDGADPIPIQLDPRSPLAEQLVAHCPIEGPVNQIPGEMFVYTTSADIPFDGSETDTHEVGDVVYWRSSANTGRFGVLFMHGNTEYGDGDRARSNGPAIRFGTMRADLDRIRSVRDGAELVLRVRTALSTDRHP